MSFWWFLYKSCWREVGMIGRAVQITLVTLPLAGSAIVGFFGGQWSREVWPWWVWGLIAIGVALASVVVGITRRAFSLEKIASPRLKIIFEDNSNYVTPTPIYTGTTRSRQDRAYYVRLSAINSGVAIARKCIPYLIAVDVRTPDGFKPTRYAEGGRLLWSNMPTRDEARRGIDLPKDVLHFFDVAAVDWLNESLQLQTHPLPARFENLFRFPGTYRFKIKIAGEDVESDVFCFLIHWTGEWSRISAENWDDH